MNLMSPSYCLGIAIIRFSKDFKTLVDEDIVHQKISNAIGKNTNSYGQTSPKVELTPKNYAGSTHYGIKNKKQVIAFKPRFVIFFVMVSVE